MESFRFVYYSRGHQEHYDKNAKLSIQSVEGLY